MIVIDAETMRFFGSLIGMVATVLGVPSLFVLWLYWMFDADRGVVNIYRFAAGLTLFTVVAFFLLAVLATNR